MEIEKMLPIFLCDDDSSILLRYRRFIENSIIINDYDMRVVISTTDSQDILLYLEKQQLTNSLFFLDIDLAQSMTGIDLAQKIRKKDAFAQIVFVTSHQEFALETLKRQIAPLNYIVKGSDDEKKLIENILKESYEHTYIDQYQNNKYVSFSVGSQFININVESIYFLETSVVPHKLVLYGKDIMYEFYGKMNELEESYPDLIRIHKSFLVNIKQIKSIDFKNRLIMFPDDYSCTFPLNKVKFLKKLVLEKD